MFFRICQSKSSYSPRQTKQFMVLSHYRQSCLVHRTSTELCWLHVLESCCVAIWYLLTLLSREKREHVGLLQLCLSGYFPLSLPEKSENFFCSYISIIFHYLLRKKNTNLYHVHSFILIQWTKYTRNTLICK